MTTPAWTSSWETIQAAARGTTSVQATFTQSKHLKILAKPLQSRGLLRYQAPEAMRWEYLSPLKNVFLAKGATMHRYVWVDKVFVPDAASNMEAMRIVVGEIRRWFQGDFRGNRSFEAFLVPGNPASVRLEPLDDLMKQFLQSITIVLATQPGIIQSVEITEGPHGSTFIEFSDVKLGEPLADTVFTKP